MTEYDDVANWTANGAMMVASGATGQWPRYFVESYCKPADKRLVQQKASANRWIQAKPSLLISGKGCSQPDTQDRENGARSLEEKLASSFDASSKSQQQRS